MAKRVTTPAGGGAPTDPQAGSAAEGVTAPVEPDDDFVPLGWAREGSDNSARGTAARGTAARGTAALVEQQPSNEDGRPLQDEDGSAEGGTSFGTSPIVVEERPTEATLPAPEGASPAPEAPSGPVGTAAAAAAAEAAPAPALLGDTRSRVRRSTWLVGAVGAVLVALVLWGVVLVLGYQATDNARAAALQTARADMLTFSTYRYNHFDRYDTRVEALGTSSFVRSFKKSSQGLGTVLGQYHASSRGKVVAAAVASISSGRAVVLLFVDQTVTSSTTSPNTDESRIRLTLVNSGGRWLIDRVQLL